MRGHNPLAWAATLLIAVAYARILLELVAGLLAVAVVVRLLLSPARGLPEGARRPANWPARVGGGGGARARSGTSAGRDSSWRLS